MIDYQPRPLRADYPQQATSKPCKDCGKPIQPNQIYVVAGPLHIICSERRAA